MLFINLPCPPVPRAPLAQRRDLDMDSGVEAWVRPPEAFDVELLYDGHDVYFSRLLRGCLSGDLKAVRAALLHRSIRGKFPPPP